MESNMQKDSLDCTIEVIRSKADELGIAFVEYIGNLQNSKFPIISLDINTYINLLISLNPKVIYCVGVIFDSQEHVKGNLSEEIEDSIAIDNPRVIRFIDKWSHKNRDIVQVTAIFMYEGIMHVLYEEAKWLNEFEEDFEKLVSNCKEMAEGKKNREYEKSKIKTDNLAEILLSDPRFNAPKVSRAKRIALAELLIPGLNNYELGDIVDRADSLNWLRNSK